MNSQTPSIEVLCDKYIRLRDAIKTADDAHKAKTAPARELLEKLNAQLLGILNTTGQDSAGTQFGTVYRTSRPTASLADPAEFKRFVIGGELWDLTDWRANAKAVEDFIREHGAPPPGVNYTQTFTVGVRRK